MNTSDLRETLASHATFTDDALVARRVAVRERVSVVRRRRRAAVGGAVAAVLAIGAAGVAIPKLTNDAAPASRRLAGHTGPATLESRGYTYEFDRGVEDDSQVSLKLPRSDRPRLVTWATKGDDNRVEVSVDLAEFEPYAASPDFTDFEYIDPGDASQLIIRGKGEVAAAVYTLSRPPAGVTKDGMTFRQEAAGTQLVAAKIADRGETESTFTFVMPEGEVEAMDFCDGPARYYVYLEFNGNAAGGSGCHPQGGLDTDSGPLGNTEEIRSENGRPVRPGDTVTVRIYLADPRDYNDYPRAAVDTAPAQMGAAIYERPRLAAKPLGHRMPVVVEEAGHRWEYAETKVGEKGDHDFSLPVDATTGPVLVRIIHSGARAGIAYLNLDGEIADGISHEAAEDGPYSGELSHLFLDGRRRLSMTGSAMQSDDAQIAYVIYRRAD
jgi:hypothetical protein